MTTRVAFVFPGQGSQHPGMLDDVPELESLDRLLDAAEALSRLDLRAAANGPADRLANTVYAQPLLYLTDWAWGATLLESGIEPQAVAGHSLGELAALALAGVFSPEAGLELVVERSKLTAAAAAEHPGSMAAVLGLGRALVADVIADVDDVWVANDNAPGQVVIGGVPDAVESAAEVLRGAGSPRIVALPVSGAFHTPLMTSAGQAFAEILLQAEFSDAYVPVYQNTDPTPETRGEALRDRLIAQLTSPVRWTETMQAFVAEQPYTLVESGPGTVLAGLAKRVGGLSAVSVETESLETIVEEVSR